MPTESLILRRVFPVPVTHDDNQRASALMESGREHPLDATAWHAAIKEVTGAIDEVYVVIDGHEVRIATVNADRAIYTGVGPAVSFDKLADLLIKADEAGYWQRPHEVVHHLEESQMSHKTMGRIAQNSFIVAGVKS
jgi:hypothetical protein